jgi:hypothetical protein
MAAAVLSPLVLSVGTRGGEQPAQTTVIRVTAGRQARRLDLDLI